MKKILSVILAFATLNAGALNVLAFAPTNVNDPSCIKTQDLKAGKIITYTRKKDACDCKNCEVKLIPYDRLLLAVTQMRINLDSDMKKIGDYIDYGKKSGEFAGQTTNFIQMPATILNTVLSQMGLTPISVALTVIVCISAAGTVTGIALKHGYFYPRAIKTDRNIKMDQHSLRELSKLINQNYWQSNNYVLISKDKKEYDVVVNFENKVGLEYNKNINWVKEFENIDAEIKLALLVNDEEAMKKLDDLFKNRKEEFKQDMITATQAIGSAATSAAATSAAYKKEKEKLEKAQNHTKEAGTQTQNDQATQTETKDTQANTNASASTNENKLTDKMEKAIKDKAEQLVNKATAEEAVQANNAKVEKPTVDVAVKGTTTQKAELTNADKNNTPKPNENKSSSIFKNPFNSDKENSSKFEASININTSKQTDDRRINVQAKNGANVTINQFIYNQTETIHSPEAATTA